MAVILQAAYEEFARLVASSPAPEDVIAFRLSETTEQQISDLLQRNGEGHLTAEELAQLDDYLRLEHIIRLAKINAVEKMGQPT